MIVAQDKVKHLIGVKWPEKCDEWTESDLNHHLEKMKVKADVKESLSNRTLADMRSGII